MTDLCKVSSWLYTWLAASHLRCTFAGTVKGQVASDIAGVTLAQRVTVWALDDLGAVIAVDSRRAVTATASTQKHQHLRAILVRSAARSAAIFAGLSLDAIATAQAALASVRSDGAAPDL